MYRGSWVIRAVVDTKPQDQNKAFPTLLTQVTPEDISDFNKVIAETCTLQKFIEGRKWGRLFGGALGVIIIDGDNDLSKPLILENVQPDSYKGMIVVDRWSGMSPSSDLITDRNRPSEYGLACFLPDLHGSIRIAESASFPMLAIRRARPTFVRASD